MRPSGVPHRPRPASSLTGIAHAGIDLDQCGGLGSRLEYEHITEPRPKEAPMRREALYAIPALFIARSAEALFGRDLVGRRLQFGTSCGIA